MVNLHDSLKALAPCKFSDVPQKQEELDPFLSDLFSQVQTIVESIPIPDPDPSHRHRSHTTGSIAADNASEMFISSARSPPPAPEYSTLQHEWGKPIKLGAKENPLGIAVYKLPSKDGKGSWFARRSVHEGLGFSRFKRGFEREFPTSLAVQGKPGEGNIRGIGAETRVEEITVPNRGKLEVYRLSAQFPGPTTPRDFVTLLVTSSKAIKHHGESHKAPDLAPRHYMIISKPCDHPETQPRNGFIRGQYESVEFIREVPRKLKSTMSSTDLGHLSHHRAPSPSLEKDVLRQNAERRATDADQHHQGDHRHLSVDTHGSGLREPSPGSRKRSVTVDAPKSPIRTPDPAEPFDPEENPVEWIMVTRSDPGGSVPRFMVERGTPASICADALKFLDWACQREDDEDDVDRTEHRPNSQRRASFASWEANGTLAGIKEHEESFQLLGQSPPSTPKASATYASPLNNGDNSESLLDSPSSPSHITNAVTETINSYTPQAVREHLPQIGHNDAEVDQGITKEDIQQGDNPDGDDDDTSTISTTSFASADSHLTSEESPSVSSKSLSEQTESQLLQQHDKEMAKLSERKAAMDAKFAKQREKLTSQANKDTEKEQHALKKAEVKHQRELKKREERYQKEVAKLEQKRKREAKKLEEKKRKQVDKDEKSRLTRERDEARAELELLKKEQEMLTRQIGELQRENTTLTARIGKLEGSATSVDSPLSATIRFRAMTMGHENRGRSSSLINRKKDKGETGSQHS
ncbi:uncharacterized protein Z519_02832 [Cladophialophora bantiana CBS 173.52]|uniref:DUF3074 domain-containing protein n=1 Tax=Cladophialophora bantiana (strain ATCC 10958 / CBS 173.52 / CDC B-1940 / NIH 8579) TaxID=1442370 RepID=A0A0D2HQP5_CLAB1|nr:uncharacterized protein Z519_02832 [Cladophialophora bantiana CBS 173.52]KIW95768.1 hypothetical protein Z519_02832 [Cladophialophora bantiana CBS 173.52]